MGWVEIAEEAARLRATYAFRTPDAVQLAAAIDAGAAAFLTNDARLAAVTDLQVVILDQVRTSTVPPDPTDPDPET